VAENGNELQLIMALAAGASTRKAGEKAGFSERTVQRRLRDDGFCREVARARGRIISRTTAMLARTSLRAVRALDKLLDDQNPAVKRMAARGVLDSLARISVHTEIEERIAKLESTILGERKDDDQEAIADTGNGGEGDSTAAD
jgi:uroporphyrinogen-III synthase